MDDLYTVRHYDKQTLVVFRTPTMMNPADVERIRAGLLGLIDEEKRTHLVLDFGRVQYIASSVIGILLTLHKRVAAAPSGGASLALCAVGPKLLELLKRSRLDRLLTIKAMRKDALAT